MKNKINKLYIFMFLATTLAIMTACDKTDDPGGDFPSAGTVKDADGNKYNTVKIGNHIWTVENLKTTSYNDGTPIPNVTDGEEWASLSTGAYCNYDNLESNASTYGRLYNWYSVNTGKLAPKGWHVPTDEDWTILENYVAANTGTSGSVAKALASTTNWAASTHNGDIGNNVTINNSTGFTALPGGERYFIGNFYGIGEYELWWSSNDSTIYLAYNSYLCFDDSGLFRDYYHKECGFSVRLVRDN
jgi:uncharacterized protein (TIGR02145 family)